MNYYKCAVWTGTEYDTFIFQSTAELKTKEIYKDIRSKIKELYGTVTRIVYVGLA